MPSHDPAPSRSRFRADVLAYLALGAATLAFFWPMLRRGADRQFVVDGDFSRQFFPFRAFEAREWWSGRIPLWNPDMFAGHPFQADIQTGVFYPIALINAVIFGRHDFPYVALEGEIVVHTFLAAVFAYLLARKLTGSVLGSMLAGVAFGFGGYITSYPAQQLAVLETAVWLPLIVLFLELAVESPIRWRWLAAGSLAFGIALLAGHPQTDLFFIYATEGYLLWRLVGQKTAWKTTVAVIVAYPALAVAIAAIQLIPTVAFLAQSSRADMNYLEAAHGYLLSALPEILVPLWHGEKALSVGVAALLLAVLGAIRARREPITYWTIVAVLALPLSTGGATPLFWFLYHTAPGWNLFRDQERVIVLFSFSVALLAARGVAALERRGPGSQATQSWPIVASVGAFVSALLYALGPALGESSDLRENLGLNALVLAVVAVVLFLWSFRPRLGPALGAALILVVLAETFAIDFGNNMGPTLPDPRPRLNAAAQFMRQLPEPFRVRGIDENVFPSNYGTLLGTPTIGGDTPFTLQRMNEMLQANADWRVWQILNVKFYLSTGDALAGLSLVFQDGPLKTYKMGDSLPRAWGVTSDEVAKDPAEARTMILAPGYHPGNIVVLEKAPSFGAVSNGPRPDVKIVQNDPQRVVIDATASTNAILVLADQYYPDWQVTRDGVATELYRANYLAMAAELPPGSHRFEFAYRPGPFYIGAGITALAFLALGTVTAVGILPRRRRFAFRVGGTVLPWIFLALCVVILAASFALRVYDLGRPVLTGDEWFMLRNHDQGPLWIIHQAHTFEPHPLIYYLGLAGWIELAGRSEFAMRFPSVVAGVLLIVAAMGLGRALISQRAGLLAGSIAALNPYQITESQNARNYAPVTAASAIASLLFLRALRRRRRSDWIAYGIAMVVALNIHYDAALVLAVHISFVVVLWLVKVLTTLRGRLDSQQVPAPNFPRWWIQTTAVVVAIFGIWLWYAWPALVAYHGFFPTPVSIARVLGRSLATFSLGTIAAIRDAVPLFAVAAIGGAWMLLVRRREAAFLGLYTLLPIGAVGLLFLARPMFDERYLIVLAPGYLLLLAAGVEAVWSVTAPLGLLVAAGVIALTVPMIPPTYAAMIDTRGDYRSMAEWLTTFGSPDDAIVATGHGQANLIEYYLNGRRAVTILDNTDAVAAQLSGIVAGHQGTFLLPYFNRPSDVAATQDLQRDAVPVAIKWFVKAPALYFGSPSLLSPVTTLPAEWNDLLTLSQIDQSRGPLASGEAALVGLHLTISQRTATPKASLRIVDQTGQIIALSDSPVRPSPAIDSGSFTTRVGVFIPPTTPPGRYRLAVLFYTPDTGQQWALKTAGATQDGALVVGSIDVGARKGPVPLGQTNFKPVGPTLVGQGLSLVGMDSLPSPIPVDSALSFRLVWRAENDAIADRTRTIELVDTSGATVASSTEPISGAYPPSKWTSGQIFDDRARLIVPAALPSGQYEVRLTTAGSATVTNLGPVWVIGPQRDFQSPAITHPVSAKFGAFATLFGADLGSANIGPSSPLKLTLQWGATATADKRYTVFVHLVDDKGGIGGQIDREPVDGHRPTNGWVAGEFLRDEYVVTLATDAPRRAYQVEVGLYDARSGARVPVTLADGSTSDHIVVGAVQAP